MTLMPELARRFGATLVIVAGLALAAWLFGTTYTTEAARECYRRYRSARTAADTAAVEAFVPASSGGHTPEVRSCGSLRQAARWFVLR